MTPDTTPLPGFAARAGTVLGGYLVAALGGALAVRFRYAGVQAAELSSGMAAFGMALLYLMVFGLVSLAHSSLLVWWLRGRVRLWLLALGALPAALASFVLGFFLMALSV